LNHYRFMKCQSLISPYVGGRQIGFRTGWEAIQHENGVG
jgi:hypothetical protein